MQEYLITLPSGVNLSVFAMVDFFRGHKDVSISSIHEIEEDDLETQEYAPNQQEEEFILDEITIQEMEKDNFYEWED